MRKKKKEKTKIVVHRDNIKDAEPGDFCYFLSHHNKILWGEIKRVFDENNKTILLIVEQTDFKYCTVPIIYCTFNEHDLKGKKRSMLET